MHRGLYDIRLVDFILSTVNGAPGGRALQIRGMRHFDYFRPASLGEAWDFMRTTPGARYVAGATDILVKIRNREVRTPALVSLRSIPQLAGIEVREGARIGATTTISDIVRHPLLHDRYPLLVAGASKLGSIQIRNAATIGGNLCNCSPCADTATPLLALEAKVRLASPGGTRELAIGEFFEGPGRTCASTEEILTDILLPPPRTAARSVFLKKGRVKMDLAVASVALLMEMKGAVCRRARAAAGSVAPVPMRLVEVEKLLEGAEVTKDLVKEAARLAMQTVSPITDIRATEGYRRRIVGVYVGRAIGRILGWSQE
jgi:CO/xanthine dehydrogenase FAD-binding subunit